MKNFSSADEVLDFAIAEEEAAAEFYRRLVRTVSQSWMRRVFEDFAMEEVVHKQKLLLIKEQKLLLPARDKISSLWIGDYLIEAKLVDALPYREALQMAMNKEKAAFKLYSDLAAATQDAELKNLFLALAQEEAKHKLRFEVEYDKHFS
jgi:rubrerythrin